MSKLIVYTFEGCPDCSAAKRVLDGKGMEYEEISLDTNPEAVDIVIKGRGKRVVPTLEYKGKFIDGNHFDPEKFEEDLAELLG